MLKYCSHEMDPRFSETVLEELNPHFSRATALVAATTAALPFGLVLKEDSARSFAPFTGEGEAAAILLSPLEPCETSQKALILRRDAILNAENLVFDTAVTDRAAAFKSLQENGFIIENMGADAPVEASAAPVKSGQEDSVKPDNGEGNSDASE